jgi:hypothetical protein
MEPMSVKGINVATHRIGVTLEEWLERRANGQKWCTFCKEWHLETDFPADRTRSDGKRAYCRLAANEMAKTRVVDFQRRKARRAVTSAVRKGELPSPNRLPCIDCGKTWRRGQPRHEYDHYLGYEPEHWLDVQAVCSYPCHRARERERTRQ